MEERKMSSMEMLRDGFAKLEVKQNKEQELQEEVNKKLADEMTKDEGTKEKTGLDYLKAYYEKRGNE